MPISRRRHATSSTDSTEIIGCFRLHFLSTLCFLLGSKDHSESAMAHRQIAEMHCFTCRAVSRFVLRIGSRAAMTWPGVISDTGSRTSLPSRVLTSQGRGLNDGAAIGCDVSPASSGVARRKFAH